MMVTEREANVEMCKMIEKLLDQKLLPPSKRPRCTSDDSLNELGIYAAFCMQFAHEMSETFVNRLRWTKWKSTRLTRENLKKLLTDLQRERPAA